MYRIIILIITVALVGMNIAQAQDTGDVIRIMTYNIRYDNPDDGVNRWDNRKEQVENVIRFNKVDIVGLQEALYHQLKWLDDQFETHDWVGIGRTNGKLEGEFSPILYNAERLELLENGTFWLSPTPEKPSRGWDAALPRICTWARFNDRESGKKIMVFNTHFDHRGARAREESAGVITNKINEISDEGTPVVLTGDFNTEPDAAPYKVITKNLEDALNRSKTPHYGPLGTYLDEDGGFYVANGEGGRRIDYIFTNQQVTVHRHGILSTFRDGRFPSDHLPVVIDVTF